MYVFFSSIQNLLGWLIDDDWVCVNRQYCLYYGEEQRCQSYVVTRAKMLPEIVAGATNYFFYQNRKKL